MKIAELNDKTKQQLVEHLIEFKKESLNLRFQKVAGQVTNTSRIRQVKKTIARIYTILSIRFKISGEKNA